MPRRRIVLRHALRNALLAPITIIMLHVNYLVGGLVVVEVIFGYPGLGKYIYDAAIFGDFSAVEAAAMVMVIVAVGTRLVGDLAYTYLNPRIRYS
jgi:peptide/nickel transport system permease protein